MFNSVWMTCSRSFMKKDDETIHQLISDCNQFLSLLEEYELKSTGILSLGSKPIDELNLLFKRIRNNSYQIKKDKLRSLGRKLYVIFCIQASELALRLRNGKVIQKPVATRQTFNDYRKHTRKILRESRKSRL